MTTTVIPLGTASALPAAGRHLPAFALERKGRVWLFDCGEGTQYRLKAAGLKRTRVDGIFITHFHGDHWYGLLGLLSSLQLLERTDPVTLVGPAGLRELLRAVPGANPADWSFPLRIVELDADFTHAVVAETDEIIVETRPLAHGTFAAGFRFEEKPRPGRLNAEAARALGVPDGPALGRLKAGEPVTLDDGTTVSPEQVVGPERPGLVVAYVTDTRPCDAGRRLATAADLLVHEATFGEELADRAVTTGHATAREAATVARDAAAERLLLTHFSARYPAPDRLVQEARAVFSNTDAARELNRYVLDPRDKEPPPG